MHKTINGWTKERMIERVFEKSTGVVSIGVAWLDESGKPYNTCRYLSPDGDRCGAGIFVKNYDPKIEGYSLYYLINDSGLDLDSIFDFPLGVNGMKEFQGVHDSFNYADESYKEYAPGYMWTALIDWIEDNVVDDI